MASTINRTTSGAAPGFRPWLKALVGVVVLGLLLFAMVVGAGVLDRKPETVRTRFLDRPPNERAEYAAKRGNWLLAESAFKEMLDEDPFDARSMFYLGYSYHKQEKFDEAKPWYEKSSEFFKYRLNSHFNLACIYSLQGEADLAIGELKTCIEGGFSAPDGIEADTDFDILKENDEFKRLVELEKQNSKKRK